jgi:hypothetical protein
LEFEDDRFDAPLDYGVLTREREGRYEHEAAERDAYVRRVERVKVRKIQIKVLVGALTEQVCGRSRFVIVLEFDVDVLAVVRVYQAIQGHLVAHDRPEGAVQVAPLHKQNVRFERAFELELLGAGAYELPFVGWLRRARVV